MVSHHELNNKWYISWDDAYHALVKYNVLSKFNALKHKKMPVVRKAKLYCYYSILLVRNAFI